MTRFRTIITRIGCNICDSPKIYWNDEVDKFHLCEKCYHRDKGVYEND